MKRTASRSDFHRTHITSFLLTTRTIIKLMVVCSIIAGVPLAMYVSADSTSRAAITVRAVGRGRPFMNPQDGRQLAVSYQNGGDAGRALRAGKAEPRALASIDLDGNATPDLVTGYVYTGGGIVTVQRGNPDAFAPKDDSVFVRMQQGYNPDSLLPEAETYAVPEPADFIQVGDFNHDNRKDVLVGTRRGDLFLLPGEGDGRLGMPEQVSLPGAVTALAAGEFRAADGWTDAAVGVVGAEGPAMLIFDGADGVRGRPMTFRLNAPATAAQIVGIDNDSFIDVAVAAGSEVDIIHGWGRKQPVDLNSRVQHINLSSNARDLAVGFFLWNRAGSNQIAVLQDDGAVNILDQAGSDMRPFTSEEIALFRESRRNPRKELVDVEALKGWEPSAAGNWTSVRQYGANSSLAAEALSQKVLMRSHVSFQETDDLMLLDGGEQKINLVRQSSGGQSKARADDLTTVSLDVAGTPAAVLTLPQKLNGERSLVVMQAQNALPTMVPLSPTAIINVDRTDDPVGGSLAAASVCGVGANDCSLRGAVQFANANAGTTINIVAGTYTLTSNGLNLGGCGTSSVPNTPPFDDNTIGDLGINASTTITGAGAGTTIIRQHGSGDRVMCLNEIFSLNFIYNFSGITVVGGRDNTTYGGAGIIGGEKGNSLTLNNVVIANNQATGIGNLGGGGIQILGGDLIINNSTIGGTSAPGLVTDRDSTTTANSCIQSGGGIAFDPSAPQHDASTGDLKPTNVTFNHNTAASNAAGGGAIDTFTSSFGGHTPGTGSFTISGCTFTNNQASVGSGGAIIVETYGGSIGTSSFTSNSAAVVGGAIHIGGGTGVTLDGTNPSLTFASSNTAPTGGTSISTAATVNVSGTNTTIGGSILVISGGVWNNNGATLSPTDISVLGGTFNCNTGTMNVSGGILVDNEAVAGGTFNLNSGTVNLNGNLTVSGVGTPLTSFNGGTGNFNFTGSGAQSINADNAPTFTFANLTVNKTGTLTANTSVSVVGGNLTVTAGTLDLLGNTLNRSVGGGTLTVSNGATLKIGGTNGLPTNYSAHSIGATSTIEYSGTTQTVTVPNSGQKYGNLIISGSGTKTLGGAISIASDLVINGGTLDASASNFNIDTTGNWFNNIGAANFNPRAATVTFSSSGGGQVISGLAGSQTFNNITVNKSGQTLSVGGSAATLTLNGTMLLSAGTFAAGAATAINVGGNWTNNVGASAFTPGAGTVTFNSTTAGQTINGSAASQTFNNLTVSKSGQILNTGGSTTQLDLNGAFNLTAGTFTAPTNTNVAGDWTEATGTTFTPGPGTVTFNGAGARNLNGTAATQTFNNLVVNKSGGGSVTGGGSTTSLTINGGLSLPLGTFAAGTVTSIGIAGNWTNNGGSFTPGTSTVTFNSSAAPQSINGSATTQTFNGITVSKSGQSLNAAGSTATLNLNGTMNISAGNFNVNTASNVNVGADWTLATGATFTPGSGTNTVTFNGAGAQNLNGTATSQTFNNFTVNKSSGTLTGGGSLATLTINKDFTITQGTFAPGATLLTINESGGNWSNSGTFTAGGGTVVFNANAVGQTLTGSTTFNNLTILHTGAGNVDASGSTLVVNGLLRVQSGTFISASTLRDVQIDSGQTLQGTNATTMSVSGNWTNNGGTFTPSGNTVNFNGSVAQIIGGTAASQTFNNFTVNKTLTLTVGGSTTSITVNDLTMTAGTFTAPATLDINGNTLLTAGTLTAGTNITAAGNWTNNGGGFTPGGGTVTFDGGAGQTIGGTTATTFNNLTNSDAGGISMNNDNTVNGVLALTSSDIAVANTKTLTQPSTIASTGAFDVIGDVKRRGSPNLATGTALTFGNPFNSISFLAQGTTPTDITVNLVKAAPSGVMSFPNAVLRTYTITPNGGSGYSATVRLHYRSPGDLNGNDPATMNMWRFDSGINQWRPNVPTARDSTTDFWAERSGVTQFSPWTLNSTHDPSAAPATISGRITAADGSPLGGAVMHLSGAASRVTITDSAGNYHFDDLETDSFYTVTPSLANYHFAPANRSFSLVGNITDAAFTANADASPSANAIDMTEYFVRQQYLDFLGREPDQGGLEYWSDQINQCGGDSACISRKRLDVSAAFFMSAEFQQTGSYVYGIYAGTLGRTLNYGEFNADRSQVLGGSGLDQAKTAFAESFVQRPEFTSRYPQGMTREQFVDALIQTMTQRSGADQSSLRNQLLGDYDAGGRALVARHASEASSFVAAEYNKAFVLMEYFGYMRREIDQGGYYYWLDVLNHGAAGNYRGMVCAFVTSGEYQARFSTVITRNNGECSGP